MRAIKKLANYSFQVILVLFFSVALFACGQENETANNIDLPSDEAISDTVSYQLQQSPEVPTEDINVTTDEGIVKLNGSIDNLLAKQRATEICQNVTGVISVINNLKVTADRSDDAIQEDVTQALNTDPTTEAWEIAADVQNGKVTLTGVVENWQEKNLVETVASGVKGVTEVENNIQITTTTSRADTTIEAEITDALSYDSRIRSNMIEVDVEQDTARLSGFVGSAPEKDLAMEKAYVEGINTVEADRLEVRPAESGSDQLLPQLGSPPPAVDIEEALRNTLEYDPRVPADSIDITIENGKAILSGTVKNLNAQIAAVEDAENTIGINEVVDNISVERKVVVKPEVPTTDEGIKSRIEEGILRDPYVENADISVEVEKGVVDLSGSVQSEFYRDQIIEIASNVKGVISVNDNLEIESENS